MAKMSTLIKSTLAEQCKAFSPPEGLAKTVSTLKQVASSMNKTISEATTATSQINNMALNYKQALLHLTAQAQAPSPQPARTHSKMHTIDPGLTLRIDKKSRQILLDSTKGEDSHVNIYKIKEKVAAAMTEIIPPPPKGVVVQEVFKLRNRSIILQFESKEPVEWL
jgi:hypothetical protein